MNVRFAALAVAVVGTALLVTACSTTTGSPTKSSSLGYNLPGTTATTVGASGAPGESNPDWPASVRP